MSKYTIKINGKSFDSEELQGRWEARTLFFECIRKSIYNGRTKASCCHCTRLITIDKATIEHIVPKSKGGDRFTPSNLTIACAPCNRKRGTQDFNSFRKVRTAQIKKHDHESDFFDKIEQTNDYEIVRA